MYAALYGLMICCFIERLLLKMEPRLQTIPENSISVPLRVIVCGSCKVMLSGHGEHLYNIRHNQIHGQNYRQTDGQTDGQSDSNIPPPLYLWGVGVIMKSK